MFKKFQQVGKQTILEKALYAIIKPQHVDTLNSEKNIVVLKDVNPEQLMKLKKELPHIQFITTQHKKAEKEINLPQIKKIIAVASGKGGVGKSTIAFHLAKHLAKNNKTGILDLDIYGPSLPTLLQLQNEKAAEENKQFIPIEKDGLTAMSLGFLIDAHKATIWRGPMVMGAVQQLLRDTRWPALDYLILDLPPGTGDAQLTLAQKVRLDSAIIITTPHELSTIDALKGMHMFTKMQVPIAGVISNMSYFICGDCDKKHYPFGESVVKKLCEEHHVPFLGEVGFNLARMEENLERIVTSSPYFIQP